MNFFSVFFYYYYYFLGDAAIGKSLNSKLALFPFAWIIIKNLMVFLVASGLPPALGNFRHLECTIIQLYKYWGFSHVYSIIPKHMLVEMFHSRRISNLHLPQKLQPTQVIFLISHYPTALQSNCKLLLYVVTAEFPVSIQGDVQSYLF